MEELELLQVDLEFNTKGFIERLWRIVNSSRFHCLSPYLYRERGIFIRGLHRCNWFFCLLSRFIIAILLKGT